MFNLDFDETITGEPSNPQDNQNNVGDNTA